MELALLLSDLFWRYESAIQDNFLFLQLYFSTNLAKLYSQEIMEIKAKYIAVGIFYSNCPLNCNV